MSLKLGDLLLPAPLSLDTAHLVAISLFQKDVFADLLGDVQKKGCDVATLIQDEKLRAQVLTGYLLYGVFFQEDEESLEPVSLAHVARVVAHAPDIGTNAYLAMMHTLTRKADDLRAYHYPTMPFVNGVRKAVAALPSEARKALTEYAVTLFQKVSGLSPESEAEARAAMPLVEVLLTRHPELNKANSAVNRAFATSANQDDVLPFDDQPVADEIPELENAVAAAIADTVPEAESGWLLYDKAQVSEALKAFDKQAKGHLPLGVGDSKSPREALLARMLNSPAKRTIVQQPESLGFFDDLRQRFPHFEPVIDHLQRHMALHRCGEDGAPVQFPPLLLIGEPGIGKTFFGQYLAEALRVHFIERDLSVVSDAMVLTGGSATWKDSAPGIVFHSLMHQGDANPLILLNEIDKCSEGGRNYRNPLSSLYSLLERRSASAWADEFVGVPVDASRVNWILTANKGYIPEPIVDRADTFQVRNPTKEESMKVAAFIWKDLVTKEFPVGNKFEQELPASVLEYGVTLPSRRLKKLLTSAAGNAVLCNRYHVTVDDLKAVSKAEVDGGQRKVGFLHH